MLLGKGEASNNFKRGEKGGKSEVQRNVLSEVSRPIELGTLRVRSATKFDFSSSRGDPTPRSA